MRHQRRRQSRQSVERARELRQQSSNAEQFLWQLLRRKQAGVKFRRQHPLGPYVIDFYAPRIKFAIELDGAFHNDEVARQYDAAREHWLRHRGITIMRIRNEELEANAALVERWIHQQVKDLLRCLERI